MGAVMRIKPLSGGFEAGLEAAFDDLVRRTFGETSASAWTPAADIVRDGEDILITLEIPGVVAGDVEVEARDRMLVVRGKRESDTTSETNGVLRREIRRGEFSRAFRLPAHVGPDAIHASYDAGMLTIRIDGAQPTPVTRVVPIENLPEDTKAISAAEPAAVTDGDDETGKQD